MARFSANLGFLWRERPIADAIARAAAAGFAAVECHWPYDTPVAELRRALNHAGLPMIGINTRPGDRAGGEFGLAALPGRQREARSTIEQAIDYAAALGGAHVHVMAGNHVPDEAATATFIANLAWAAERAAVCGIDLVIEPINQRDAPGYFLSDFDQAAAIINRVGFYNLRLMFDCYHAELITGDCLGRLERHMPLIGHIQIASVPDRHEPDEGSLDFHHVIARIDQLGYTGYIGAEYHPRTTTDDGLGWLETIQQNPQEEEL